MQAALIMVICMGTDDNNIVIPPHERPVESLFARAEGRDYVAYKSLEEAGSDNHAIVIFVGDYGGQVYLTCPIARVKCSQESLSRLLYEMGLFSWGDGEDMYFERARPDGFVAGGMGGGIVQDFVWIHKEFRNLLETGVDILPEVTAVIEDRAASIIPGAVAQLVAYLDALDISTAKSGQMNFGKVADIADQLRCIGAPAIVALPALKRLSSTGIFRLADQIKEIEQGRR